MYNSYTLGFLSLCMVFVMSACDSRGPCEKNYEKGSEIRACIMGSDQMGEQIMRNRTGAIPTGEQARQLCEVECHKEFNPQNIPVGNDGRYFDEMNNVADLFRACVTACTTRLQWELQMETARNRMVDSGCEPVDYPGGGTRCY